MDGPRYETRFAPNTTRPCTGCGGRKWSSKGECLNEPCVGEKPATESNDEGMTPRSADKG